MSQAAFVGPDLVALQSATLAVRPSRGDGSRGAVQFTYYEAEGVRTRLTAGRTRFVRPDFTTAVAIRSSVGAMNGSRLGAGADAFVVLPGGTSAPPPVVWCCTADGDEVVVESDGRPAARTVVAAGVDGGRVRMLARDPGGAAVLMSAGPAALPDPDAPDPTTTIQPFPGSPLRGVSAFAAGTAVWTDAPRDGVMRVADVTDTTVTPRLRLPLGGRILAVHADGGDAAAIVRTGAAAVRVVRVDLATGRRAVVWRGPRVPRVAVGGGVVAVADRRAVFGAAAGPVRRVATASGPVAAVAATAARLAWFERVTRRVDGTVQRRTRARLARVRG